MVCPTDVDGLDRNLSDVHDVDRDLSEVCKLSLRDVVGLRPREGVAS